MKIKKKTKKKIGIIIAVIILIALAIITSNKQILIEADKLLGTDLASTISFESINKDEKQEIKEFVASDDLKVYFIDVGQADSILILNKEESMLIDAGNNEDGETVVNFIKDKGITKLKYVVGTHPHEDHIGGLDNVINTFEIENILMPKIQTNTKTFEDVLDAISNKELTITAPKKGDKFNIGEANCEILNETIEDKSNLNLSSIIIRLDFGNKSFLFTGDAETENENSLESWEEVDVLKVGHHGSTTSSSMKFLKQVSPEIAIIMVGKDNEYGHPKKDILKRLNNIDSKIYRTDENGTILVTTDGNEINVNT